MNLRTLTRLTFPKGGLAVRYSLFFLTGILIIFLIAFVYSYIFSRKILMEEGKKDARTLTDLTIVRLENIIQPIELVPQHLVRAMETIGMNEKEAIRMAREYVIESPQVFGSCLAYEPYTFNGKSYWYAPYWYETRNSVKFKILGNPGYDYFKMDWYRLPKLLNRPVWTEPYFDKGGGDTLMCTFSVPFYKTEHGKRIFRGVLTMDVSLSAFERIVNSVRVYKSGYGFLVSRKGMIINYPTTVLIHENILDVVKKRKGVNTFKAVSEMLQGKRGFVKVDGLRAKQDPSFIYYAPLSSTGWSLGIIFPEQELFSDIMSFFRKLAIIFIFSVLAILVTTILITRKFTRPISRLVEATRRIGQGDFQAPMPIYRSKDEISQLTNAFSVMKEELMNYIRDLRETTTAKEKIESELNVAHTIQMGMLPTGFPVRDDCDLYAVLESARAVGGDLYDFFFLDENHLCFAIGDVAGKGVPASLFMMVMRTLFRSNVSLSEPLHEVFRLINRELCRENPKQMFVTFWAGIINLETGETEFCNAGHNIPFMVEADGPILKVRQARGIPLGVIENAIYTSGKMILGAGATLIIYTDGVTEAISADKTFYGEQRLIRILEESAQKKSKEIVHDLVTDVRNYSAGLEQADDITVLVLGYKKMDDKTHFNGKG